MSFTYRHAPGVLAQQVGNEIVVGLDESTWFTLRGTAAALWRLLESPLTVEELAARCAAEFAGSEQVIREDVASAISVWLEHGLLARS